MAENNEMNEVQLLQELEPVTVSLYERHLKIAKPWYPHELIPFSRGQDFEKGYEWSVDDSDVKEEAVRAALYVNLLTEDNLPYYYQTIDRMFGRSEIWREWNNRWVAEEARHSIALRDFMTVTRAIDPKYLEDGRMQQMSSGEVPQPDSAVDGFVYVALQELATRIAHRNTAKKLTDPVGQEVVGRVGADENFHYLFYRDLVGAALEIAPSLVLPAIKRQIREFEMPGAGIAGFKAASQLIAISGVYGANETLHQVFEPVVNTHWHLQELGEQSPENEKIVKSINHRFKALGKVCVEEDVAREQYQEALRQAA